MRHLESSMDEFHSTASASVNVVPKPRTRQACEPCRVSKLRCLPSRNHGVCTRCLLRNKECIFAPERLPRKARTLNSCLDGGFALKPSHDRGATDLTFCLDLPHNSIPDALPDIGGLKIQHEEHLKEIFPQGSNESFATVTANSITQISEALELETTRCQAEISDHSEKRPEYGYIMAEKLLSRFEKLLPYLPCIMMPHNATVRSLSEKSPFLLLAILTAASSSFGSPAQHEMYDKEFRKVLSFRALEDGQKSLELLQGILIYTAWYPPHLNPNRRRTSQYLRIASDMVLDFNEFMTKSTFDHTRLPQTRIEGGPFDGADRKSMSLACLSCYYLSSGSIKDSKRRQNIPFGVWVDSCWQSIAGDGTDITQMPLFWLIRLQHMEEEIYALLYSEEVFCTSRSNHIIWDFKMQLKEWRDSIPKHVRLIPLVRLTDIFLGIMISGPSLVYLKQRPRKILIASTEGPLNVDLDQCLEYAMEFLELFLSISPQTYSEFSSLEWERLIYVIIIASRLSFDIVDYPEWDSVKARTKFNLGEFLGRFSQHVVPEPSSLVSEEQTTTGFGTKTFPIILGIVKTQYENSVAQLSTCAAGGSMPYCGFLDSSGSSGVDSMNEQIDNGLQRCPYRDIYLPELNTTWDLGDTDSFPVSDEGLYPPPNFSLAPEAANPHYHDLWATMTMSWAAEN